MLQLAPLPPPSLQGSDEGLEQVSLYEVEPVQPAPGLPAPGLPAPVLPDHVEEDHQLTWVAFQKGSVPQVFFLGKDNPLQTSWKKEDLQNYFFHANGCNSLCMRASEDCNMGLIRDEVMRNLGKQWDTPIITYKGTILDDDTLLSGFPAGCLFLVFNGIVPEVLASHGGKLWECVNCAGGWSRHNKIKNSKACQHVIFPKPTLQPISWNASKDRDGKIWAAPAGQQNIGAVRAPQKAVPQQQGHEEEAVQHEHLQQIRPR